MSIYTYQVLWADLDGNQHLKNTRYLDYASHSRFRFLTEQGFGPKAFAQHKLGPVVFEDRVAYRKELRLMDTFTVSVETAGRNERGSRFIMVNRICDEAGELCAEITSMCAWFDLAERKVAAPPSALFAVMEHTPRTSDYRLL